MVGAYGELKDAGRLDSRQVAAPGSDPSDSPPSGERPFSAELYSGLLHQDDDMIELTAACPPPTWSGRRASSCDGSGAQTVSRPSSTVSARPASPTRAPQAST